MVRPAFPPRPPGAIGMLPALSRPPVPGMPGVRPIMPPVVRPAIVPVAAPTEKPQTTVYVGKIASTVENDFILSLLQVSLGFFCDVSFSCYIDFSALGYFPLFALSVESVFEALGLNSDICSLCEGLWTCQELETCSISHRWNSQRLGIL